MKFDYKITIIFLVIVYLYSRPRYITFLPTIPIYDNNEASIVYTKSKFRTQEDIGFFTLTDPSIIHCFSPHVQESDSELRTIITHPTLLFIVYFFKYTINRPRPYQINENIRALDSNTGNTPSLPAGHALQAYYLARILSKKYPNKKNLFSDLAEKCDKVRVDAGIHYPSDGAMSKWLVDMLMQ